MTSLRASSATQDDPESSPGEASKTFKIEPHGPEHIPNAERHGRVSSCFSLWWGANVEFATIGTGVLATALFGLSFKEAVLSLALGNLAGSLLLGLLSTYGPRFGAPQLVQSRSAFGFVGNFLPGGLNFIAGCSWFAVNTVLGVFALDRLLSWSFVTSLIILTVVQVGIAVVGHNLIHGVERYLMWVLTVIFALASIWGFKNGHLSTPFNAKTAGIVGQSGAFITACSIAFSYCLGWIPFASDYTRYLPENTPPRKIFARVSLSLFISCVWLELLGASLGTLLFVSSPTDLMAGVLPHYVADITLVGVVIGTVTANVLNLYSGALSLKVIDVGVLNRIPRWVVVLVAGVLGAVATYLLGQHNFYQHYETFLFLLGYWVMPWLAIVIIDVSSGRTSSARMYDRSSRYSAGLVCWVLAILISVPFMNQAGSSFVHFVGPFAASHPTWGDITYYVGGVAAAILYGSWKLITRPSVRTA